MNIKGIKKRAVPLLNGTALSTQGSRSPELVELTKRKCDPIRPHVMIMIMCKHNQAINNQCAFGHSVRGCIAMEVVRGVAIV